MSIPLFISLLLFIGLVFYADTVVQLLKLDRNFDDDRVEIGNLNLNNILILAVVIIGGFLILDNIAALASRSFYMFQKLQMGISISYFDKTSLVISAINVIIGYILITNYKSVAKILKIK